MSTTDVKSIRSLWEEFDAAVNDGTETAARRLEDEGTFYAGALSVLVLVMEYRHEAGSWRDFGRVLDAYRAEARAVVARLRSLSRGGTTP
jgi:hypothetical protein